MESTIVMIEEGEMVYSDKQRRHRFAPVGYALEMFHLHCLQTTVEGVHTTLQFTNNSNCCLCGDPVDREPSVFRLTVGQADGELFSEHYSTDGTELQCVEVCAECILYGLGDGDLDVGLDMLGLHQG
jgi:hypothetical protein